MFDPQISPQLILRSGKSLSYWRKGLLQQNFGDLLSEVFYAYFGLRNNLGILTPKYEVLHLVGSVISDWHIQRDLEHCSTAKRRQIAFWGCGMRDHTPIEPDKFSRCVFLGVRGPLSSAVLGLATQTPVGDPALLLSAMFPQLANGGDEGDALCIPHFLEPRSADELLSMSGADRVLSPRLGFNFAEIALFIQAIAHSKFVLAGALHAAIVAAAFGKPFAFFDGGFVDIPFKWADFAASINVSPAFVKTVKDGKAIYFDQIQRSIKLPPLAPIARCAPGRPPRRFMRELERLDRLRDA